MKNNLVQIKGKQKIIKNIELSFLIRLDNRIRNIWKSCIG